MSKFTRSDSRFAFTANNQQSIFAVLNKQEQDKSIEIQETIVVDEPKQMIDESVECVEEEMNITFKINQPKESVDNEVENLSFADIYKDNQEIIQEKTEENIKKKVEEPKLKIVVQEILLNLKKKKISNWTL